MKHEFPPGFTIVNKPNCASCIWISKVLKTKTAYCSEFGLTFPMYEAASNYVCDNFEPLRGLYLGKNIVAVVSEK